MSSFNDLLEMHKLSVEVNNGIQECLEIKIESLKEQLKASNQICKIYEQEIEELKGASK